MPRLTLKRAFELGALAMKQTAIANCVNLTESLMEGLMTDGGLRPEDKKAMNNQIVAINEVERQTRRERVEDAAYYGSYILPDAARNQIRLLFPEYPGQRPPPQPADAD